MNSKITKIKTRQKDIITYKRYIRIMTVTKPIMVSSDTYNLLTDLKVEIMTKERRKTVSYDEVIKRFLDELIERRKPILHLEEIVL